MATQKQPNRSTGVRSGGGSNGDLDVELSVRADLAAKDANKFLVGLVIMAIVFALLLPITVLMYMDIVAIRATIRAEAKDLRKLKEELKRTKKERKDE